VRCWWVCREEAHGSTRCPGVLGANHHRTGFRESGLTHYEGVEFLPLVSLLGPVDPPFRALSGRLKLTIRRHKFNKDSLCGWQSETLRVVDVRNNRNRVVAEACFDGQYWVNELVVNSKSDVVLMCAGRQGNVQEKGVVEILKMFHTGDKTELKVSAPNFIIVMIRWPGLAPWGFEFPPASEECK